MKLDFSKQRSLYQRGFETDQERQTHNELIEKGFTCVDAQETPFADGRNTSSNVLSPSPTITPAALEAVSQPLSGAQAKPKQALMLELHSGTLNYSELARDIFNYIQRNQINVDVDYWRAHPDTNEPPEAEKEYLERILVERMKLYSKYGRNYAEEADPLKRDELENIDTMVSCAWALLESNYTMKRDTAKAAAGSVAASGD